jgi:hypothetical protein
MLEDMGYKDEKKPAPIDPPEMDDMGDEPPAQVQTPQELATLIYQALEAMDKDISMDDMLSKLKDLMMPYFGPVDAEEPDEEPSADEPDDNTDDSGEEEGDQEEDDTGDLDRPNTDLESTPSTATETKTCTLFMGKYQDKMEDVMKELESNSCRIAKLGEEVFVSGDASNVEQIVADVLKNHNVPMAVMVVNQKEEPNPDEEEDEPAPAKGESKLKPRSIRVMEMFMNNTKDQTPNITAKPVGKFGQPRKPFESKPAESLEELRNDSDRMAGFMDSLTR